MRGREREKNRPKRIHTHTHTSESWPHVPSGYSLEDRVYRHTHAFEFLNIFFCYGNVLKFNLKKQTNLKNCNLNILISREFFDIDNQFNRQRMSKICIALKEKRGEKIMFYFDNFVVSLPIRPIVYRRCSPQSFEICLREKSRSPHTHTRLSLWAFSFSMCVSFYGAFSLPFRTRKEREWRR